jgi:hypothetical protein
MGGGRAGRRCPARLYLLLLVSLVAPLLLALPRRASADIDGSIQQLRRSRAYKVRLSAALFLAKQKTPRAILALARALIGDPDATVRRVAALSLARMVDATTEKQARRAAVDALDRARRRDRERRVRESAQEALITVRTALLLDSPTAGRIFVHVGPPADPSRALPSGGIDALLAAVRGSLLEHAPDYELTSGMAPTHAELTSRRLRAYSVIAQVAQVEVERNGSHNDVRCTVSVRVSPWSGRDGNRLSADDSASVSGSGRVTASQRGTRRAAVDCAVAVTEELSARHVIPFLRRLAAQAPP